MTGHRSLFGNTNPPASPPSCRKGEIKEAGGTPVALAKEGYALSGLSFGHPDGLARPDQSRLDSLNEESV